MIKASLDDEASQILQSIGTAHNRPQLSAEVGALLAARFAAARAAWPGVELTAAEWLAPVVSSLAPDSAAATLAALHLEDLYLARAALAGDPRALAEFERSFSPVIRRAAATVRADDQLTDEVRQRVLVRVLAQRATTPPALATFGGKSPLGLWLRAIAIREALTVVSASRTADGDDDELSRALSPDEGPELAYMKRLYRDEYTRALRAAIAALPDRQRTLLRHSVLDGLGIDQLAPLYQVHRATIARWLAEARAQLVDETRRTLLRQLRISRDELDSILRMIESQLDASLHGL